ncbi:MAG TPA: hypothetical protein VLG09_04940 [Candidatus Saccharimonadales bacterium]|nr:hypothetical protein [Candidatus Saccharimonadales bacterium]
MDKATRTTLIIIGFTIIGYLASFLIPVPSSWTGESLAFHWTLANSVLYTLLHIGAAILFLIGVSAYKAALRVAYAAIAGGIVLVGAGLAQVVFLNVFGLIQSPWAQYGGVMTPFVIAGIAIYLGVRSMAKLVGITSPLTKLPVTLLILAVCVTLSSLLPHGTAVLPELYFDISNAISVWDVVFYATSLALVLQIKKQSGAYYTNSMAWLIAGLIGSVVITLSVLAGTFAAGTAPSNYLLDTLVIIGGLLYLKAGHSFAKTKEI